MLANPVARHKVFLDLITMPMTCAVCCACAGHAGRQKVAFRFPSNTKRFRDWTVRLRLIQKRDEPGQNSRVCLDHFQSDCFERHLKADMLGVREYKIETRCHTRQVKRRNLGRWVRKREEERQI